MMERLKMMKDMLMGVVEGQMTHLDCVDTEELGDVIDMIKDLEEAMYYCTVTEAMHASDKNGGNTHYMEGNSSMYYMEPSTMYRSSYRDMDRDYGRMYYNGGGNGTSSSTSNSNGSTSYFSSAYEYPMEFRDAREGRSPKSRKMYMESKEAHQGKAAQMKELEKYVQELTQDLTEMVEDASPEEQQYLANKVQALSAKISALNK